MIELGRIILDCKSHKNELFYVYMIYSIVTSSVGELRTDSVTCSAKFVIVKKMVSGTQQAA